MCGSRTIELSVSMLLQPTLLIGYQSMCRCTTCMQPGPQLVGTLIFPLNLQNPLALTPPRSSADLGTGDAAQLHMPLAALLIGAPVVRACIVSQPALAMLKVSLRMLRNGILLLPPCHIPAANQRDCDSCGLYVFSF